MGKLHVFFFPMMMLQGHMIPTLDIAKLFASRGVKSTLITTPGNAHYFTKSVEKANQSGFEMGILTVDLSGVAAGFPEGFEGADQLTSGGMGPKFKKAVMTMLQDQLERILNEVRPDCLVADSHFPWATQVAAKFGIPRLEFNGTSFFALCAWENMRLYRPQREVSSDDEPFLVPNLPHKIRLTKMQLRPEVERNGSETDSIRMKKGSKESELSSYGIIVNSFCELETEYADYYRNVLKRRAWHIGPVSLCNREVKDKAQRGKKATIDEHDCLKWLDSKEPNSVIYICFGSLAMLEDSQLYEIAMGLESTGQQFIWAVRREKSEEGNEKWLPEGFEERMKDKGLIIRGWAPQVLILDHEAVGGFVTHCGWNSTLEGVSAGVPMVTWPVFAEQFYNEKFVTEILRTGVSVGNLKWSLKVNGVRREEIGEVVQRVMVGEEAEEMRSKARGFKEMAKTAIEEGGSSYSDLNALIRELTSYAEAKLRISDNNVGTHAIAAIQNRKHEMGPKTGFTPVLPPFEKRKLGRPKMATKRDPSEDINKKDECKLRRIDQNSVRCGKCGKHGHNRRTCTGVGSNVDQGGVESTIDQGVVESNVGNGGVESTIDQGAVETNVVNGAVESNVGNGGVETNVGDGMMGACLPLGKVLCFGISMLNYVMTRKWW